jgi:drug/metabolite transporter (DMT)-like permease
MYLHLYFFAFLITLAASVGQIFLKQGAMKIQFPKHFINNEILYGLIIYALCAFFWIWLISKINLSKIYPFLALTFIFVPMLSKYFLGEIIPINQWAGILIIFIGLIVISCFPQI